MKTEVIMKRPLFGIEISQKSKTEFLSATDLVRAGNKWRNENNLNDFNLSLWFTQKSTVEFMEELNKKYGVVKISGRGRGVHTWVHPFLFIDIALAISPKLKIETYEWLYDHLLKYRNNSGDSYKKMSGALYNNCSNKSEFADFIKNVAKQIQNACGINSWEEWQKADIETLQKRDRMHENIALLTDILPLNEAVRIGILKS